MSAPTTVQITNFDLNNGNIIDTGLNINDKTLPTTNVAITSFDVNEGAGLTSIFTIGDKQYNVNIDPESISKILKAEESLTDSASVSVGPDGVTAETQQQSLSNSYQDSPDPDLLYNIKQKGLAYIYTLKDNVKNALQIIRDEAVLNNENSEVIKKLDDYLQERPLTNSSPPAAGAGPENQNQTILNMDFESLDSESAYDLADDMSMMTDTTYTDLTNESFAISLDNDKVIKHIDTYIINLAILIDFLKKNTKTANFKKYASFLNESFVDINQLLFLIPILNEIIENIKANDYEDNDYFTLLTMEEIIMTTRLQPIKREMIVPLKENMKSKKPALQEAKFNFDKSNPITLQLNETNKAMTKLFS